MPASYSGGTPGPPCGSEKAMSRSRPVSKKMCRRGPAFFYLYRVGDYCLESKNALVKLARLVQVKCGKADVGKSFVTHGYAPSFKFSVAQCEQTSFEVTTSVP